MTGPGSRKWRAAGRPAKIPAAEPIATADTSDLKSLSPEDLAKHLSREALLAAAGIMRKPGRHAAAQMRAIELVTRYGVQEPAKAQTITQDTTHRLEGDINIVLVPSKDGRRAE